MTISWNGNLDFGYLARRPESLPIYLDAFNDVAGKDPTEVVRPLLIRLGEARLLPVEPDQVVNMSPREMMDLLYTVRRWGDALGVFENRPDEHLPPLSAAGSWSLRNPNDLKKFYLMQLAKFQIPHGIGGDISQVQAAINAGVLVKPFLFLLDLIKTFESIDRYEKYVSGAELESWVFPSYNQAQMPSVASAIIGARRAGREPPSPMGPMVEAFREFLTVASYTELLEVRRSWLVHEGAGFRVREGFYLTSLSGRVEDSHRARMIDYLLGQYGPRYFIFNPKVSYEDQVIEWTNYYTSFDFGFEQRYSSRQKVQLIALESPDVLEPPFYLAPIDLGRKIRIDGFVKFVLEDRDPVDFPEKLRWIYRVIELGTHPENGRSRVRLERYRRLAQAGESY
ncbi:MAG: hypothetical protein E3J72_05450 [Planctomycetota bacterium]|nr:MAG: hypothetical protein E3J72_05450 [Planctomycetota bacterium]